MMKTIKYLSMAALLVVGAIIMSCSTSDDMPGEDQPKSQTVTVTTTISLDNGATRALDASGHKTFEAGDKIAVIYKNTSGNTVKATSVPIAGANISSDKKTATFTVTLDNPQAGTVDYVYPAAMANDDGTMASIDSQDGTLATIQSKYDYARGSGTMTVSGTNATLPSNVSLVNQLAICKFTIKNSGGTDITSSINNLTISDGTNNYAVTPSSLSNIYVAMKPVDSKTITLNATAGGAGYVKTVTGQTLNASKFYPINVTMEAFSPTGNPFTIEAKTAGTIKIANPKSGMKYTKNGGDKTAVTSDAISVAAGDILQFYGNGTNIKGYGGTTDGASTKIEGGTADFYAYGNIMSLLDEDGFATNTDFSTSTDTYTFAFLFYDNTHLYSHPAKALELPATTLLEGCYYYMFYGCTHLTKAPVLPAATLVKYCYANMFRGCSSLNYVKCLTTYPGSGMNYTTNWLSGVPSSGTFVKKSGVTWESGIPSGWTVTEE